MKKPSRFSPHLRHFQHLARRLNRMLAAGTFARLPEKSQARLLNRLQQLYAALRPAVSTRRLKRALAGAAMLLGIGGAAQAQNPNFLAPVTNPFGLSSNVYYSGPCFVDLDADGDMDLLSTEAYGAFKYFMNVGTATAPQFSASMLNPFGLDSISTNSIGTLTVADMDADGDQDVFAGLLYGSILYYENTGTATTPNFAAPVAEPFGLDSTYYLSLPEAADLDGDGDFDLLIGEYYGRFQYFENVGTDSMPQFAAPVLNPFGIQSANYQGIPTLGDLDGDGDLDLMHVEGDGAFIYQENLGDSLNPIFGATQTNAFMLDSLG
ncbi:MAG: VCBS repeat-containing protein, partial [Bacteroidota bacterium]